MVVHDVLGSSSEMQTRVMDISSIPPSIKNVFFLAHRQQPNDRAHAGKLCGNRSIIKQ